MRTNLIRTAGGTAAVAVAVVAVVASSVTATAAPSAQSQAADAAESMAGADAQQRATDRIALILDYTVGKACDVFPNYPKEGVIGNDIGWKITPGDVVAWRYNVNDNWAMISDKKYRNDSNHPWWGLVPRDCIGASIGGEPFPTLDSQYPAGEPIPQRLLEGRSAVEADHYTHVGFRPSPATVVRDGVRVRSKGTLRDAANRFVIGNVDAGWHVRVTDQKQTGWTKVYVPNAQRWGYVQDIHL